MFDVRVQFPFDATFESDDRLEAMFGKSAWAGTDMAMRDHGFQFSRFEDAVEFKRQVADAFPEWGVSLRER